MISDLTERARDSIQHALLESQRLSSPSIDTEHLLLGVIHVRGGALEELFEKFNLDESRLQKQVESLVRTIDKPAQESDPEMFTSTARRALDLAFAEARVRQSEKIDAEHLLLGLALEEVGAAGELLRRMGINPLPYEPNESRFYYMDRDGAIDSLPDRPGR